jgi:glycosyltransferase involved in cell wall biosynthesis
VLGELLSEFVKNDIKLNMQKIHWPKLLYIGDVSVSNTVAGEILLYRLLQTYPPERLQIVEGNTVTVMSILETRLSNVVYQTLPVGNFRLLHSRFVRIYSAFVHLTAHRHRLQLKKLVEDFKPEAILTVLHGFSWLTAAVVAKKCKLPLHLITHDDWPHVNLMPKIFQSHLDKDFGKVYRQAVKRYCVSPYMEEIYRQRYGVEGTVLYPSRGFYAPEFKAPPQRIKEASGKMTVAYAGSLHLRGYITSLIKLADFLEPFGGQLIIHSNINKEDAQKLGLHKPNVSVKSLIPSERMVEKLREEADVLYVPMTFEERFRAHMQTSFPSKLAEYTATGLPILIWGPSYCSAVRWAKENLGIAEIVDNPDVQALRPAV